MTGIGLDSCVTTKQGDPSQTANLYTSLCFEEMSDFIEELLPDLADVAVPTEGARFGEAWYRGRL